MTAEISQRSDAAPRWASAWIVVAIALVLNWTVPGTLVPGHFEFGNAAPGLSSSLRATQPGTLPRIQPRSVTAEAGVPKQPESKFYAGAKPELALPAVTAVDAPLAPMAWRTFSRAAAPPVATRFFDPRAPPAATA